MIMMDTRKVQLQSSLEALYETDIPLIAGQFGSYTPSNFNDDQGIYYFIPMLAKFLGLHSEAATNVFMGSLLILGSIIALSSFFLITKQWVTRIVSILVIGVIAKNSFCDVYTSSFFAVAATIPPLLMWSYKRYRYNRILLLLMALVGIISGYSNMLRTQSGTGILLFLIFWLALSKDFSKAEKIKSILISLAFFLIPYMHFHTLEKQRDEFLKYQDTTSELKLVKHPKWHAIYLGLSFIENSYGIRWDDNVARDKALSIDPEVEYCSPRYEKIIKDECLKIAKNDPLFVAKNLFKKLCLILFKILKYTNLSVLLLFIIRPSMQTVIPFIPSTFYYSLPGLLVLPLNSYLTGMLTISTIFGIYMLCIATEKYRVFENAFQIWPSKRSV